MSLLVDLLADALGNLFVSGLTDKQLDRLAEQGELVPATIYAIRVVCKDDGDQFYYGLDLTTRSGLLRASVRQQLLQEPWRAPLGARVLARHLDGRVAIDWPATLAEHGVRANSGLLAGRTLRRPLEPGVEDGNVDRKRLRTGTRVEAEVLADEPVIAFGMPTENRRLELRLHEATGPRNVTLKREHVPPYAAMLVVVGARLPVAVDPKRPDRVTVDWPAAAEAAADPALVGRHDGR